MTIRPDVDIMVIMKNISQKIGDFSMATVSLPSPVCLAPGHGVPGGGRRLQAEGGQESDRGEDRAILQQCRLVAGADDRTRDREGGEDGTEAIARRHHAGGKAALVREPPHHLADDADIDDAGAQSAQHAIGQVQLVSELT